MVLINISATTINWFAAKSGAGAMHAIPSIYHFCWLNGMN